MKKTIQFKLALFCMACIAFFILPSIGKAQITCNNVWTIYNNTSCTIHVNFFYTCNGVNCSINNLGVPIAPGSINVPACNPSCTNCNFFVRIVRIAGVGYSGPGVDFASQTAPITSSSGCVSATANMTWDGLLYRVDINP